MSSGKPTTKIVVITSSSSLSPSLILSPYLSLSLSLILPSRNLPPLLELGRNDSPSPRSPSPSTPSRLESSCPSPSPLAALDLSLLSLLLRSLALLLPLLLRSLELSGLPVPFDRLAVEEPVRTASPAPAPAPVPVPVPSSPALVDGCQATEPEPTPDPIPGMPAAGLSTCHAPCPPLDIEPPALPPTPPDCPNGGDVGNGD